MNRAPSTPGRIAFVGSGPGDPGLLTVRARDAIAGAPLVVTDPDVAEGVLALVADGADIRPAVGEPADVAAGLVAEAAAGRQVVRLVGGDPLTADAVVAETLAVAAAGVPFDVVPGVGTGTAVPAYAGVPLGSAHVEADVRAGLDWASLAAVPGPLVLHATAAHLLDVVTGLTEHGVAPTTPVAVTSRGTLTAQKTVQTTLAALASEGADLDGPLVVTIGDAVA
jgi:uroporphyrinogen III methyltransferase / synthase